MLLVVAAFVVDIVLSIVVSLVTPLASTVPAEQARKHWSREVLRLDPSLNQMDELFTDWMAGIQYYLNRQVDITHGHMTFIDAPWALTALTQDQFWADREFRKDYGDGKAIDSLSVDISNWDVPGMLLGKTAKECTAEEVAAEVLHQIKYHHTVGDLLPDEIIHSWFLDPGVAWDPRAGHNNNETPLLINTAGSWTQRPTAKTPIPNLMMSGDFVQTDIDLATMEGANESARHAVNAILEESGSKAEQVTTFKMYDPPEFEILKRTDKLLYKLGQKNLLDVL